MTNRTLFAVRRSVAKVRTILSTLTKELRLIFLKRQKIGLHLTRYNNTITSLIAKPKNVFKA